MNNNLFSNSNNHDENDLIIIESSSINSDEPAAKKRKMDSSSIKIDGCNKEKIVKLEDTVAKLQAKNEEEKIQHKNKMDSVINEYSEKIKTFEEEKRESDAKIKELTDEISSMKIIKMEIKDSVECERETCQSETIKLKAEINELKNQNYVLEQCNRNLFENYGNELKILKEEKEAAEKELKNLKENVQFAESKEKMGEERKHFLATIDALKAENQNLSNVNINFMNAKKSLQNSFNDLKKRIKNLETHKSEMQNFQLDDVFSDLFFGPFNPKK